MIICKNNNIGGDFIKLDNLNNYIIKSSKYDGYKLIIYKNNTKENDCFEDEKLDFVRDYEYESMARAKRTVLDIAMNNSFEWFVTFTIDRKKVVDRTDFKTIKKDFLKAINNYNSKYQVKLSYIVVPELHANRKGVHFHCLMSGFDTLEDFKFTGFDKKKGYLVFKSKYFYDRFGANFGVKIVEYNRFIAYYVSKYITKSADRVFYHRYFRSEGLEKSFVISKGKLYVDLVEHLTLSWETPFMKIYDFDDINLISEFLNNDKIIKSY